LPLDFATNGDVTQWEYQTKTGLLIKKSDAANKGYTYEYDSMGRMAKRIDGRGWVTKYKYTIRGQLESTDYDRDAITTDLQYKYHRNGALREVTDAAGIRSFSFYEDSTVSAEDQDLGNKSARLKSETLPSYLGAHTITYSYQYGVADRANGAIQELKLNTGSSYKVSYAYDEVARLQRISYNTLTPFTYTYVANSNLVDIVSQDTSPDSYAYHKDVDYQPDSNRISTIRTTWGNNAASAITTQIRYNDAGLQESEQTAGVAYLALLTGQSSTQRVRRGLRTGKLRLPVPIQTNSSSMMRLETGRPLPPAVRQELIRQIN
jgi:YD repeat-containing protein